MFDFGFGDVDQNEILLFLLIVINFNEVNIKIIWNSVLLDLFGKKDFFIY